VVAGVHGGVGRAVGFVEGALYQGPGGANSYPIGWS
jgi:hypothetical protein